MILFLNITSPLKDKHRRKLTQGKEVSQVEKNTIETDERDFSMYYKVPLNLIFPIKSHFSPGFY